MAKDSPRDVQVADGGAVLDSFRADKCSRNGARHAADRIGVIANH